MIKILKFLFLIFFNYLLNLNNNIKKKNDQIINIKFFNEYFILQKKNINNTSIYYNITSLEYFFSFKYNIIKIKYDIIFYDENLTLIKPSDLSLYYELHALCHIKQIITGEMIDSIAGIRDNKNFYCIEYIRIDESFKLGIKIYEIQNNDIEYKIIYLLFS